MENENVTPTSFMSTALRYGLIGAILTIAVSMIGTLTGLSLKPGLSMIFLLINIVIIVMVVRSAIITHRTDLEGYISFGKGFGVGFMTILVLALISAIFSAIYNSIDPSVMENAMATAIENAENQGQSEEQIEMIEKSMKFMQSPVIIGAIGFISTLFMGTIIALIMAAILKTEEQQSV